MDYKLNEDDLKILLSQVNISKNEARKLLIKNKGDISQSILDSFDYKETEQELNIENQDETTKKLKEFRKILDEKDTIFCQLIEKNREQKKNN